MCGLAGFVRLNEGTPRVSPEALADLRQALAHRGPDGAGTYEAPDGRAALVHRRLAIIDTSEGGAQPMSAAGGRFRLVFNGEVFNYRALRVDLESAGETFTSDSDTEVLLRLLVREGPSALARVRGMFALALWDARDRSMLLARDRFGIKPLYLSVSAGRLAFASEIGALVRARLVDREACAAGLLAYLTWASIPPPLTWVRGVDSLVPGTWRRWNANGHETSGRFADVRCGYLSSNGAPGVSEAALRERVGRELLESLRAHLTADVPVGIFLSGGVDSSALVAAACAIGAADIKTYTVAFEEDRFSEEQFARRVADRFGTTHHVVRVDLRTVRDDLPLIVDHLDQPTADAVNSYYVSKAVASTGLKAVLSGTGGDELFGGYPSFRSVPSGAQLHRRLGVVLRSAGPLLVTRAPEWKRAKLDHFFAAGDRIAEVYRARRGLFMPHELVQLVGPALLDSGVGPEAQDAWRTVETEMLSPLGPETDDAAVARLETQVYLRSQLLRDIDVMSMAHGLEVRVPFVDEPLHRAVWPAVARHPHLLRGKRLLHESLPLALPATTVDRPKHGFTFPLEDWMRGTLQEPIRAGLRDLAALGWIAAPVPDALWKTWERGDAHWSRPWALGILGCFLTQRW